jgi:hypothetical protein
MLGLFFYPEDGSSTFSETPENIYQARWHHILEDSNLHMNARSIPSQGAYHAVF